VPDNPRKLTIPELISDSAMFGILLGHAYLGIRVQFVLRAALAAFLLATIALVPPIHNEAACFVVIGLYVTWGAMAFVLCQRGGVRIRLIWCTLATDVIVLGLLSLLASSSHQTWTTDVLVNGFFLVPMLATTELRPVVGAAVTTPALAFYLAAEIAAQPANSEPTSAIVLGACVLAALSVGCVSLSWVQRSRVLTIAGLIYDRQALMAELVGVERTARQDLAEELHDGALQYVLAARQDLEDARDHGDPTSLERIGVALTESATLLRAKVSQLHPAVVESAGLRQALAELCRSTERPGLEITLHSDGWTDAPRGAVADLIYSAAREFLANVVRHAHASQVEVTMRSDDGEVALTVSDDGVGIADDALSLRLRAGHVGIASQRTRIEAMGGTLTIADGKPGTVISVAVADPVA
jgi:two-component system, NarL family, sensor kinase